MAIRDKLEVWRKDLLDMSRNNKLLYFSSGSRTSSVQFTVDTDDLFRKLLYGTKPYIIVPDATALESDECLKRLGRLRSKAREALNDRGMHVLYVAFGMLEWYETPMSEEVIRSPLILVPTELRKEGYLGSFQLSLLKDEDITINPTLRERLLHDFKIELPTYEEIENTGYDAAEKASTRRLTLTEMCQRLRAALPPGNRWRIAREAHLGAFSFQKLVMYQDLTRHAAEAEGHAILRVLGGEPKPLPQPGRVISAEEMDERLRPHEMLEILDADSSQQEAIQAAKAGRSFVLQGPPGTGKSQTIANIIAECLGQNRHVLFVSEKMAALKVVHQRLSEAGLGDFLLDLHSSKADKKAFIAGIKTQVEAAENLKSTRFDEDRWYRDSDALTNNRKQLNTYVRELHAKRGPLNKSAFAAYGEIARRSETPDVDATLPDIEKMTDNDLRQRRAALEALLACADVLDKFETYPWRDTLVTEYSLELQGSIRHHFGRLEQVLDSLDEALGRLRENLSEDSEALTFGWARIALRRAEQAIHSPLPPEHWMLPAAPARLRQVIALASAQAARYHDALRRFEPFYLPSARNLDTNTLLPALTDKASWAMACLDPAQSTPQDAAIMRRDELAKHLTAAKSLLPRIMETSGQISELLGLSAPTTVEQSQALEEMAMCLLETPMPPEAWLNADTFASVRVMALDASERYVECARTRAALKTVYAPALFTLNIPVLAQRFSSEYASVLRFVKPAYYTDARQVRMTLQPEKVRGFTEIRADLAHASALLGDERLLRDTRVEHARMLGRFFNGEATDWTLLRAAIDWATHFHTLMSGEDLPREIVRLATGAASVRASLRDQQRRLADLLATWHETATALEPLLKPSMLAADALSLASAPADALLAGIERLHVSLRAYWQAVDAVAAHDRESGTPPTWASLCACLRLVRELEELEQWLASQEDGLRHDLGARYAGWDTNWSEAGQALIWVDVLLDTYPSRTMPGSFRRTLSEGGDAAARERLKMALDDVQRHLAALEEELHYSDVVLPRYALLEAGKTQEQTAIAMMRERVRFHLEQLPCLERWLDCARRRAECAALGLNTLLQAVISVRPFPRDLVAIFEKRFHQLWLDAMLSQSPTLARFSGDTHEQTIARFRALDGNHKTLARQRLAARLHSERLDAIFVAQSDKNDELVRAFVALRREVNKKRHRSIRRIAQSTAPAMLMLKPCWMMSPLSVSQYLDSAEQLFDVVIFDEASQVCPEDAICAILRGKQLIVVGDSKQLPPTRFFTKTLADASDDADDEAEPNAEEERTESVLDECIAASFPQRWLTWHYRSRHESLIAFSNTQFYHGKLQTFPGPQAEHGEGVHFVFVEDGDYDRGHTRRNRPEAERVVDLILEHVYERPELSLGVVALSEAQQNAIRDALEGRRKREEELAAYDEVLDEYGSDGFFIKNLESVQGDERDVIILSAGYGPDRRNGGRIAQNFGPVNRNGGERRLNVAVTRAKHQLILVTSMHANNLAGELKSPGARALRDYLEYAELGPTMLARQERDTAAISDGAPQFESPFEEAVYHALTAKGLNLAAQVGCSSYRIDLAVRDPRDGGRFLLGIECDGAMYHSSKTARDRDRLRQQHLERMGWRIHRIWSRDWIRNPVGEVAKVLRAVEDAQVATVSGIPLQQEAAVGSQVARPLRSSGPMARPY